MNQIKVLLEGYVRMLPGGWEASSTCTLITTDSGLKILVDPGCARDLLLAKLTENNLKSEDINIVFITHHHTDHVLLVGMFPKARVVDNEAIFDQDRAKTITDVLPETDIKIVPTPGHEETHASLAVTTAEGTVVVAGDVFWWEQYEEQKVDLEKKDDFATDMIKLSASRKKVLEIADWIIPGHGKMWKVDKNPQASTNPLPANAGSRQDGG